MCNVTYWWTRNTTHVSLQTNAHTHTHSLSFSHTRACARTHTFRSRSRNRSTATCLGLVNCFSSLFSPVRMAAIDWRNEPLTLVVIFFALCLLLLTWSIAGIACCACHSSGIFLHCDTHTHNFFFCLYSSCVRAYVTQCALVVAVILKCSSSWGAFRSIQQSTSFQSYCSYLLSVLALGPTVILRVYSCLDPGPETGRLQHV